MSDAADVAAPSRRGRLVEEVLGLVAERVPRERATALTDFARAYLRRISDEALAQLHASDLFSQIMGVFEFADRRGDSPIAVRVFDPTLGSHGYATVGSVIETNCEDSPFLVDSVVEELAARDLAVRLVVHPVVGVERGQDGAIQRVLNARDAAVRESVMHFEVGRHLGHEERAELAGRLRRVLADVQAAVRDFAAMQARVPAMIEAARGSGRRYAIDEIEETRAFLEWLLDANFVFLGYREYALEDGLLSVVPGEGLGILADDASSRYRTPVPLGEIDPGLRERLLGGGLLVVSKTNRFSTVHRRAKMDDLTVKRIGPDGATVGALRLLGLFARKAYMAPASKIPILSRKLRQIVVAEDLLEESHDYKAVVELFESFPKDELFTSEAEELRRTIVALLDLQERRNIQLFLRRDLEEGRISVLVALPRDRFNAELRHRLQALFLERLGGSSIDYHLSLGEEDQARIHFTVHVDGATPEVSFAELEQEVAALARTWDDRLRERLVPLHGEERGHELADRYAERFPDSYKSSTDVSRAVLDIEHFERVEAGALFAVGLQNERGKDQNLTRVGLYKAAGKVRLSDFLPILEDLGLTVVEEVPTRLETDDDTYLHDFGVLGPDGLPLDLAECGERLADCIAAVWRGEVESDPLNGLVVTAGLTHAQVAVLRAYRTYRVRVGASFTLEYENQAYRRNPAIARRLVELFELRFDPTRESDEAREEALAAELGEELDRVRSLDEDRILRAQLGLIEATVRTNAFRPGRSCLALKLDSRRVPDMPKPAPLYEIYVYSPAMEGIHLRGGRVSRGGIRFSDRKEDYRTEILGLMKAQMVKNAVIVPVGSKGGFVLKRTPPTKDELRAEVVAQYSTLIRGLLDLTDNLVGGELIHPEAVRVLDDDGPYLVVAADKGTATFSDVANGIAAEYNFWLGDAFASGGSTGYDHKELGITAKGAWESVKRHFRELGRDPEREPVTVVGVGDMSGDVFGNGMLLSSALRLVAAFDHRHVFLDPAPDEAASYAERRRLFELPGSSWADYDRAKISPGGGVFARDEKEIVLSAEARAALATELPRGTPSEVIAEILKAPVDLFWNGGIGTFVKASFETNAEVGDRGNDAIRVDGRQVRARVVAEGGNLGFTQKGRIEFADAGGRINIDAIDNSAGVDCSDHEVNLKILLGLALAAGELTQRRRDDLLREVEGEVAARVLYHNYLQAQIVSQEAAVSTARIDAYEDLMATLETERLLDRQVESLPSPEEMAERTRARRGMARPELCILLAYAKRSLEEAIRGSSLPEDPFLGRALAAYFPARVVEECGRLIDEHPLRRDLVATILANEIVNSLGITWASRLALETGAEPAEVARAYCIAREVAGAGERWADVEQLDGKLDPAVQNVLMVGVDTLVEDIARWYLLNAPPAPIGETAETVGPLLRELETVIERTGSPAWRSAREDVASGLADQGVPHDLARRHAFQPELAHVPDIAAVAATTGRPLEEVAHAFFLAGERLRLDWLERRLAELPAASRLERWAGQALGDDLMALRRAVALRALERPLDGGVGLALEQYLAARGETVERLGRIVDSLTAEGETSLAALTVALRQLRALVS